MTHPPIDPNQPATPPDTEPPVDPPPAQPPAPTVNLDEVRNIYNAALQEANRARMQAESEAQRLRDAQNAPAPTTPEQDRQTFFDNPRQMLREEMQQIIAPLNQFQQRYTKQETYNNFLAKAVNLPGFAHLKNPLVLQGLANAASQMQTLTDDALGAAYNMIVGHLFNTGQLTSAPPAPAPSSEPPVNPPAPTNPPVQPPPKPRPATPLPPVNTNKTTRRQLNEHEKQLARFNNMTDDAFLDFLEMDAKEVARSSEVK